MEKRLAGMGQSSGGQVHRLGVRVYYEDTDLAGIVYYANYLRFIERGRSEWLRALGLDQRALKSEAGCLFIVRRIEADYLRPAHFDDALTVETRLLALGGARIDLAQDVLRADAVLFRARVVMACIGPDGAPARIPQAWRAAVGTAGGDGTGRAI
jgi:acyl-CoA thioester hydrolase